MIETILVTSFILIFIYVALILIISLITKKLPIILITIGKYAVIVLFISTLIYYIWMK